MSIDPGQAEGHPLGQQKDQWHRGQVGEWSVWHLVGSSTGQQTDRWIPWVVWA